MRWVISHIMICSSVRNNGYRKERVIATYQHLDVWLLAHFSQDQALINALTQERIDPFRAIAGAMGRKPLHEAREVGRPKRLF